jgi:hypothetical protein
MSKNTNSTSQIITEWQKAFPQLVLLSNFKFCKVVGPVIFGIELTKLPRTEKYRPHFVIYGLWGNKNVIDLNTSLKNPVIIKELYNKKGLQFSIPYDKSSDYFVEVLEAIKSQIGLSFDRDLHLDELLFYIDAYLKTTFSNISSSSFLEASIQKIKMLVTLYIDSKKAQDILEQIKLEKWDISHFNACLIDLNMWLEDLQEIIYNRRVFLNQIDINKRNVKLKNLIQSELIR